MTLRIRGIISDPYAVAEGTAPSPFMAELVDGRWKALTARRYQAANRGFDLRYEQLLRQQRADAV